MDGEYIAEKMNIEAGEGTWILNNCVVVEVENDHDCHAFEVYMETDNGSISRQTVIPADADACDGCRAALDRGESPVRTWEDGNGQTVCPDNGEIVEGGYSFEHFNGNCGDVEYYETADEAVREAESAWDHLTDRERKEHIISTRGAVFNVLDPYGNEVCDFIANAKRAADREEDADRAEDDVDYLRAWFEAFAKKNGVEKADSCIALSDGGWDGSESVPTLMREYGIDADEANDTLDYLKMMTVQKELESRIESWTGIKVVRTTGKSLGVTITEGCRILGVDVGDYVEVTIRKV